MTGLCFAPRASPPRMALPRRFGRPATRRGTRPARNVVVDTANDLIIRSGSRGCLAPPNAPLRSGRCFDSPLSQPPPTPTPHMWDQKNVYPLYYSKIHCQESEAKLSLSAAQQKRGETGCRIAEPATYVERPLRQALSSDISSCGNGAVICPAFQRGRGPLALMKFAMRGANQLYAL
jgi:hypothetical protein